MKRWLIWGTVLVLGGIFWWGLGRDPGELKSVLIGKPAPDFELPLFPRYQEEYGETITLERFKGQPVVVNFWASWCYPACWNEAPRLEAAWRKYRPQGVQFIGINIQDKRADAEAFLDRFGLTFPHGIDPPGRVAVDYGTYGVPETFFIDKDGIVRYRFAGEISSEELEKRIQEILP
ncbi:TlpA family protein disulfide reductase [Marinithermus hydrothermalis]|uniref:Alkyl hydroperoxide reductase/ Thiol specific antioxidant/ Mal allergen n=1 Tax=Marinithermus hydrothermalis (strain DSM 14884 / JCM 11576 / T1) TaxID=869210 RepID=F2NMW4_MARHT|nr:TlpA disulfide reductase family protein [Marinithermus hydrothermalis]AEB12703.1 alkyl hydroperoxide reductase/ Thiol specific antioxidant/ Mal allergen [Marinithermus hydrothermalis DSM 14884]